MFALLGLLLTTSVQAQVHHRFTGPRAKNYKYWMKKKEVSKSMVSLNGMIVPGQAISPVSRKMKPELNYPSKKRITGPRVRKSSLHLQRKDGNAGRKNFS